MESPAIQSNYFSNSADLDILTKLVMFTIRLYNTKHISELVIGGVMNNSMTTMRFVPTRERPLVPFTILLVALQCCHLKMGVS